MSSYWQLIGLLVVAFAASFLGVRPASACAPVSLQNTPVVNADQTVIMIWDAKSRTQHFIRQASFQSKGDDLGFLVPTPTQPELEEAGDSAFAKLAELTAPEVRRVRRPHFSVGCSSTATLESGALSGAAHSVQVLQEKRVAGLEAVVLKASSSDALVGWLREHGYAYSPEVAAWAEPYLADGWKITALKVVKDEANKASSTVAASALRISFRTSRPLFPYREPDMRAFAADLGVKKRLLRIYFLAERRYQGDLTPDEPWTGQVVWAGKVSAKDRAALLGQLRLPPTTEPQDWYLTEFEDQWPYRPAPADVYFRPSGKQDDVRRPPQLQFVRAAPTDVTVFALAMALVVPAASRRWRRGRA
jgi:hypothetical protein